MLGWLSAQYPLEDLKPSSIMQMFLKNMEYLETKTRITEIKKPSGQMM